MIDIVNQAFTEQNSAQLIRSVFATSLVRSNSSNTETFHNKHDLWADLAKGGQSYQTFTKLEEMFNRVNPFYYPYLSQQRYLLYKIKMTLGTWSEDSTQMPSLPLQIGPWPASCKLTTFCHSAEKYFLNKNTAGEFQVHRAALFVDNQPVAIIKDATYPAILTLADLQTTTSWIPAGMIMTVSWDQSNIMAEWLGKYLLSPEQVSPEGMQASRIFTESWYPVQPFRIVTDSGKNPRWREYLERSWQMTRLC